MKNKVLLITLTKSFKSLDKIKKESDKIIAFKFVLDKATSMLKMVNARIENIANKTDKKLKKEQDKIKLNEKIKLFMDKNINLIEKHLSAEHSKFQNEFDKLKQILNG